MGIDGFHPATKHYATSVHISKYRGHRVGCDASAWLHRGAIPYAWELHQGLTPWRERNEEAPWVAYSMKMIRFLHGAGVCPVIVFDGCRNPAKEKTNAARRRRQAAARADAERLLADGQEEEAKRKLQQAVKVTPEMAFDLIQAVQRAGVPFIVAPYEADSQLAYLANIPQEKGGVKAVITEDSDLVAYGCPAVLFKWNKREDLEADEITSEALFRDGATPGGKKSDLSFAGWDAERLLAACLLAGSDFLPSVKGIAFKKAHKFVADAGGGLQEALGAMKALPRWQEAVSEEYEVAVQRAADSFRYAPAFDPCTGRFVRLRELPPELTALPAEEQRHLGPELPREVAHGIAHGYLNPHTLEPFDPARPAPPLDYVWPPPSLAPLPLPPQQPHNPPGGGGGWTRFGAARPGTGAAAPGVVQRGPPSEQQKQQQRSPQNCMGDIASMFAAPPLQLQRNKSNANNAANNPAPRQQQGWHARGDVLDVRQMLAESRGGGWAVAGGAEIVNAQRAAAPSLPPQQTLVQLQTKTRFLRPSCPSGETDSGSGARERERAAPAVACGGAGGGAPFTWRPPAAKVPSQRAVTGAEARFSSQGAAASSQRQQQQQSKKSLTVASQQQHGSSSTTATAAPPAIHRYLPLSLLTVGGSQAGFSSGSGSNLRHSQSDSVHASQAMAMQLPLPAAAEAVPISGASGESSGNPQTSAPSLRKFSLGAVLTAAAAGAAAPTNAAAPSAGGRLNNDYNGSEDDDLIEIVEVSSPLRGVTNDEAVVQIQAWERQPLAARAPAGTVPSQRQQQTEACITAGASRGGGGSGNSSGGAGKRKRVVGEEKKRGGKKVAEFKAAARNCLRISSFFDRKSSPK